MSDSEDEGPEHLGEHVARRQSGITSIAVTWQPRKETLPFDLTSDQNVRRIQSFVEEPFRHVGDNSDEVRIRLKDRGVTLKDEISKTKKVHQQQDSSHREVPKETKILDPWANLERLSARSEKELGIRSRYSDGDGSFWDRWLNTVGCFDGKGNYLPSTAPVRSGVIIPRTGFKLPVALPKVVVKKHPDSPTALAKLLKRYDETSPRTRQSFQNRRKSISEPGPFRTSYCRRKDVVPPEDKPPAGVLTLPPATEDEILKVASKVDDGIQENSKKTMVNLASAGLTSRDVVALGRLLRVTAAELPVDNVDISGNDAVETRGFVAFLKCLALAHGRTLVSLNASRIHQFGLTAGTALARRIGTGAFSSLVQLHLSGCGFDDAVALKFARALRQGAAPQLTALHVASNAIGSVDNARNNHIADADKHYVAPVVGGPLGALLDGDDALDRLDALYESRDRGDDTVCWCALDDFDFDDEARRQQKQHKHDGLDVEDPAAAAAEEDDDSDDDDETKETPSSSLQLGQAQLRTLDASRNLLRADVALGLGRVVARHSHLVKVSVAHNLMGDAGTIEFARVIVDAPALEVLDVSANDVGPAGAACLAAYARGMKHLATLRVRDNPIGATGAVLFLASTLARRNEFAIDLRGCETRSDTCRAFTLDWLFGLPVLQCDTPTPFLRTPWRFRYQMENALDRAIATEVLRITAASTATVFAYRRCFIRHTTRKKQKGPPPTIEDKPEDDDVLGIAAVVSGRSPLTKLKKIAARKQTAQQQQQRRSSRGQPPQHKSHEEDELTVPRLSHRRKASTMPQNRPQSAEGHIEKMKNQKHTSSVSERFTERVAKLMAELATNKEKVKVVRNLSELVRFARDFDVKFVELERFLPAVADEGVKEDLHRANILERDGRRIYETDAKTGKGNIYVDEAEALLAVRSIDPGADVEDIQRAFALYDWRGDGKLPRSTLFSYAAEELPGLLRARAAANAPAAYWSPTFESRPGPREKDMDKPPEQAIFGASRERKKRSWTRSPAELRPPQPMAWRLPDEGLVDMRFQLGPAVKPELRRTSSPRVVTLVLKALDDFGGNLDAALNFARNAGVRLGVVDAEALVRALIHRGRGLPPEEEEEEVKDDDEALGRYVEILGAVLPLVVSSVHARSVRDRFLGKFLFIAQETSDSAMFDIVPAHRKLRRRVGSALYAAVVGIRAGRYRLDLAKRNDRIAFGVLLEAESADSDIGPDVSQHGRRSGFRNIRLNGDVCKIMGGVNGHVDPRLVVVDPTVSQPSQGGGNRFRGASGGTNPTNTNATASSPEKSAPTTGAAAASMALGDPTTISKQNERTGGSLLVAANEPPPGSFFPSQTARAAHNFFDCASDDGKCEKRTRPTDVGNRKSGRLSFDYVVPFLDATVTMTPSPEEFLNAAERLSWLVALPTATPAESTRDALRTAFLKDASKTDVCIALPKELNSKDVPEFTVASSRNPWRYAIGGRRSAIVAFWTQLHARQDKNNIESRAPTREQAARSRVTEWQKTHLSSQQVAAAVACDELRRARLRRAADGCGNRLPAVALSSKGTCGPDCTLEDALDLIAAVPSLTPAQARTMLLWCPLAFDGDRPTPFDDKIAFDKADAMWAVEPNVCGDRRVDLLVGLSQRLSTSDDVWAPLFETLTPEERGHALHRLGILNVWSPVNPDGWYLLDLAVREDRCVAKALVILEAAEAGSVCHNYGSVDAMNADDEISRLTARWDDDDFGCCGSGRHHSRRRSLGGFAAEEQPIGISLDGDPDGDETDYLTAGWGATNVTLSALWRIGVPTTGVFSVEFESSVEPNIPLRHAVGALCCSARRGAYDFGTMTPNEIVGAAVFHSGLAGSFTDFQGVISTGSNR